MLPTENRNPILEWNRETRNDGNLFSLEFQALYANDRYFDNLFSSISTISNDGTMIANSANTLVTQASVKTYADSKVINDSELSANSTTKAPSQASVRSFVNSQLIPVLDEDNFASDSPSIAPSQQSTKAFVENKIIDEDSFASNSDTKVPTQQSVKIFTDTEIKQRHKIASHFYDRNDFPKVHSRTNRNVLVFPEYMEVNIDEGIYYRLSRLEMDIDTSSNWDTATYATPANRVGLDFYIFACKPITGNIFDIKLSRNNTIPTGYTIENSRKIGGFHCLCVSAGVTTTNLYAYVNEGKDPDYLDMIYDDGSTIADGNT